MTTLKTSHFSAAIILASSMILGASPGWAEGEGNHQAEAQAYDTTLRRSQVGKCAEGYSPTAQKVDGQDVVYECIRTLQCIGEFRAEAYEVIEADGRITHRYRCKMLDKSQMINLPAE